MPSQELISYQAHADIDWYCVATRPSDRVRWTRRLRIAAGRVNRESCHPGGCEQLRVSALTALHQPRPQDPAIGAGEQHDETALNDVYDDDAWVRERDGHRDDRC